MTSWRRGLPLFAAAVLTANVASAQGRTLTGSVIDSGTKRGGGALTVGGKGTNPPAVTERDGSFSLARAPEGELNLTVEAPDYERTEVTVPAGNDSAQIALSPKSMGEEIVVSGRASETKRKNIGVSVATVRSEDLSDVASETVDLALQGKVAGANIQRNDGAPGGGAQVRLRGVSSINGQAEPLFVLDGMIVSNVAVPSGISVVTKSRAGSNPSPDQHTPGKRSPV